LPGEWKLKRFLFAAVLSLTAFAAQADDARYDRIVDEVVARYHLPGIAVGVIDNGHVVYKATRGELVAGSGKAVTTNSLFKIASNSKAMTASVLARLVEAGKLQWDAPVVRYLPDFAMHDPWVTRNMQVRDLLVHNSGLPEGGGDLMLWPEPNAFTRADVIHGLRYIKPAYSFRSGYAYDNLLYVVAGEVAASAGGASYEELMRREVFQPLGLTRCRVGAWRTGEVDDVAQPHMRKGNRNVTIGADGANVAAITHAAAGGIRCSLDDMLAWAGNWLAPTPRQLEWLPPAQRRELWKARTPMPISERRREWDNTHYLAYADGWRLADVDGEWNVSHTGTLSGMYSVLSLLPDRKSGFVVLINGDGDAARTVLTQVLLKHFTAPDDGRSVAFYADALAQSKATVGSALAAAPAGVAAVPADMATWLGVYRDPWFGDVSICPADDGVRFRSEKSPLLAGRVMRVAQRYLVDWDGDSVDTDAWLTFSGGTEDTTLKMAKFDPDADFSSDFEDLAFTRVRRCE
jgi:Beta-lactamase class C and other penicillin binding proteins